MALTFSQAVAIAEERAVPAGGLEDTVHCGDGVFGFLTREKPPVLEIGGSDVIVVEDRERVWCGSLAPRYLPDDYEVRRLDGVLVQTREEVRAAQSEADEEDDSLESDPMTLDFSLDF